MSMAGEDPKHEQNIPSQHTSGRTALPFDQCDSFSTPSTPIQSAKKLFNLGDHVRKKSGAAWQGKIVGWYCTKLTPEGYAVESEFHSGSVQIYPAAALELV